MRNRSWFGNVVVAALALMLALLASLSVASAEPWSFGVMGDTQWGCPTDPANANPNRVPVSIIEQVNRQFVAAGVKFVLEVGDLTERGNDADLAVRAAAAQTLYDAGIGFFPMRGNHDTYGIPANYYGIPGFRAAFPQTRGLGPTWGAANFSSPVSVSADLDGMSYSFDYLNSRFVIIDPWVTPSQRVVAAGYAYGYSIAQQQDWISSRLARLPYPGARPDHAFVFSHQPVMPQVHQDGPFVGYLNANLPMQNAFFASMYDNGVGYYFAGHDHVHQRSIVASPDGLSSIHEVIAASNSSKSFAPTTLASPLWFGQKARETSVSQERFTVGFYIVTVDGPRVTVDYYSDDHGGWLSGALYPGWGLPLNVTPTFSFVKKETWGYSLNGREFLVPQGACYASVQDSFQGTRAWVLAGTNGSTATDGNARAFTKTVNTGWTPASGHGHRGERTASDILTLWGMTDLGSQATDTYALAMTYDQGYLDHRSMVRGKFGIATRDGDGGWTNAVDANFGGVKRFVLGPWSPSYGLGTYGLDLKKRVAWAVINYDGEFAVTGRR